MSAKKRCSITYGRQRCVPFRTGIEGAQCTLDESHADRHLARVVVQFGDTHEKDVLGDFWFEETMAVEPETSDDESCENPSADATGEEPMPVSRWLIERTDVTPPQYLAFWYGGYQWATDPRGALQHRTAQEARDRWVKAVTEDALLAPFVDKVEIREHEL